MVGKTVEEASVELAEAMRKPAREVAELVAEYHALKNPRAIVTADGETMEMSDYEQRLEDLHDELKDWLKLWGDEQRDGSRVFPMGDGCPDLRLSYPNKKRTPPLRTFHTQEPEIFFSQLEADCVVVDATEFDRKHKKGYFTFPREAVIADDKGAPRLAFDERGGAK